MPAFIDLTGKKFGRLTVVERASEKGVAKIHWTCRCDCGAIKQVAGCHLSRGATRTCGCSKHEWAVDYAGQRFGRWTVIEYAFTDRHRDSHWKCKCDCGTVATVNSHTFNRGKSTSCGCYAREVASQRVTSHGKSKTREYFVWRAMRSRCTSPSSTCFSDYGGRGIGVCARWLDSFEAFYADMGPCPDGLSLDRINNDGDYAPENCRWTTCKVQGNNSRRNKIIEHAGERKTMSQWADHFNVPYRKLKSRIRRGWAFDKAVSTP